MEEMPGTLRAGLAPAERVQGREVAEHFIEAHRQKIFLGLSVAGTLLLGPFAINDIFQDRAMLGLLTMAFVACLLLNALSILRGRPGMVSARAILFAALAGLVATMYQFGLIGIVWAYPALLLFHFMLPRRMANVSNATLVLVTVPLAWMHVGPELTVRVAVTMILVVVFTNIFSAIADAQQAKEAEQRAKLDAAVRQLEAQNDALRNAFRVREEVERIARHDLKTPLASIASVSRLLREARPLDTREQELLGMVERAALRVLSMVNLSLDLFHMEEGSYRLRAQAVDLAAVVQTLARELDAHARSKKLRLALELPAEPLYAQGEELLCYSTVANLLKNALEASPEGADVHVHLGHTVDAAGDWVLLAIHNLGGVPPAVRESFFEKYATHGKPGGMGLGAYSARTMARVQRGDLHMESDARGTTLSLRLPRWHAGAPVPAGADPASQPGPQPSQEALPELSVLLVDDDEYNIVVLRNLLPSPPLVVRTAVNGRAALECVREARPDVIFLDLQMPVMGGLEAIAHIRALQRARGEAPSFIAAFSAHDDEVTRGQCLEAGFDVYLAKPASREEVLAVLHGEDPAPAAEAAGPGPEEGETRVWIDAALMPLMPQFLSSRRALVQELKAAAAQGQRDVVRVTAHKLAGSLAMYGFAAASRASLEVENAAASSELGELTRMCEALAVLLAQAQPVVRSG